MNYIDTHCHIYSSSCEDIDLTVNEALESNVKKMVNCSENIQTSKEIIELSKKYKNVLYPTVGIHPEYADSLSDNYLVELESLIKNNKIIAIGEIGLDYYYTKENKEAQIRLFENQLKLAEKYNLPVIIHLRDATKDTIDTLKKYNVKGIIHSFTGSYETAIEYIKMGFYLGINGVITFKNSNLKDTIKKLGIDHIVLETDSPFLSPHPFRGKTNAPKNIPVIAEFISDFLGISIDQVQITTTNNATHIFDI